LTEFLPALRQGGRGGPKSLDLNHLLLARGAPGPGRDRSLSPPGAWRTWNSSGHHRRLPRWWQRLWMNAQSGQLIDGTMRRPAHEVPPAGPSQFHRACGTGQNGPGECQRHRKNLAMATIRLQVLRTGTPAPEALFRSSGGDRKRAESHDGRTRAALLKFAASRGDWMAEGQLLGRRCADLIDLIRGARPPKWLRALVRSMRAPPCEGCWPRPAPVGNDRTNPR